MVVAVVFFLLVAFHIFFSDVGKNGLKKKSKKKLKAAVVSHAQIKRYWNFGLYYMKILRSFSIHLFLTSTEICLELLPEPLGYSHIVDLPLPLA